MYATWYGCFFFQAMLQHIDDFFIHVVRPKELFKVEWIHLHYLFIAYRDGIATLFLFDGFSCALLLFLLTVALHTKQRPCSDDVITTIFLEELQASTRFRAVLDFIKDNARLSRNELGCPHLGRKVKDNTIYIL